MVHLDTVDSFRAFYDRWHPFAVLVARASTLLQFDESGAFRGLVGGPGQGPGEFRVILAIRPGLGDSTLVMDAGNRRLAVLDRSFAVARTGRLPVTGGWFGVVGDGGILVLSAIPGRNAKSLHRLFLLDRSLSVERSFMPASARGSDASVESFRRRMAVSRDGVIAVSHWRRYAIEVWGTDEAHKKTVVREPGWFRAQEVNSGRSDIGPPEPVQEAPRIDPDGRLWTLTHVPDEDWRGSLGRARTIYRRSVMGVPQGSYNDYYDSIVEVIDIESGQLIASRRVHAHLTFISNVGHAASYREDDHGYPFIDVWRLEVVRR